MKTLKFLIKQILCLIIVTPILPVEAQNSLTIKWGLENTEYFREIQSTQEQNSTLHPTVKKKDKYYRDFVPNAKYNEVILDFFKRHHKLWDEFKKSSPDKSTLTKLNFARFASEKDPYFAGLVKSLAPKLYFDFVGQSKEYVLESITITTINFEEFKGGGFSINEAWYDIELKHTVGTYNYDVDKKLRFNGSGRAELRFWSDNYYPNFGMTPSGEYTIDIKFNFLIDGEKITVSTGTFKIDV